jgi:hypothetical protein
LKILAAATVLSATAHAQVAVSLRIAKTQHVAGEPVLATVIITNHAGRDLAFSSDGRFQWLHFNIRTSNGTDVNTKGNAFFGAMKIKAGETLAREVDLSQHFQLSQPGNYSVSAFVHAPGSPDEGSPSNRVLFSQSSGHLCWSQKVGVSGRSTGTREYRVLSFTGDTTSQMYAQIVDGRTGQFVRTFPLGDALMLRQPLCTVDRDQRLHTMFLATPTMWLHYVINTDGKVISRQIHQRAAQGDPELLTFPDGSVRVSNSIPYDEKAAAEQRSKVRKASDRPAITY